MGKATGFMEFDRVGNTTVSPENRITNYNEFHAPLNMEQRREQAARCMNCGVPFCQSAMKLGGMVSGCPLHNLIPEWNDELYNGHFEHALNRLLKTNCFPEFTGRVCPALCEAACTCGLNDSPVTVHDNELAVIEYGFVNGYIKPAPPAVRTGKKVAVIGSGPSGLACAEMLNKRGHSVTVFEREDRPGGLLMYGIPNMKLDKSVVMRRVHLMEKEGVEFRLGCNIGADIPAENIMNDYDAVVLCCGASNPRNLNIEGRELSGVHFAVDFLKSTTKALLNNEYDSGNYISAKDKNVLVVGGGDTGNDCVGTCMRHGCKSIVQLEMMPKLPDTRTPENAWPQWPRVCKTDYGQEEAAAVFGHDPRVYQTTIKRLIGDENGNLKAAELVKLEPKKDEQSGRTVMTAVEGSEYTVDADLLLIAAGFLGSENYVTESFGVQTDARSNVLAVEGEHKTSRAKVFTAGDMHRGQSLVVWAISEGRAAAREVDKFLMRYTNMI
ncbi:MAG: glutamate synthase subunit beta [Clostridia bacterium]|nr:glutamate synthase subunit beta [Clostridia bacterium]